MRKPLAILAFVFAAAFGYGAFGPTAAEAGSGNCYFTCDCAGNGLYCCVNQSGTSCKPAPEWNCPQVYEC